MNKKQRKKIREELADLAHQQWSGWMKWMGKRLTSENVERWGRQMNTPYEKLSEREKDSDRIEADKYLKILDQAISQNTKEVVGEVLSIVMLDKDLPYSPELKKFVGVLRQKIESLNKGK